MIRPFFLVPLAALGLSACDGETIIECAPPPDVLASLQPSGGPARLSQAAPVAVWVSVVDSVTGADLTAGASGTFVTRTFADSLRHDYPTLLTAYGPAGRYSVMVQHPGYATWGTDDVRVEPDECGLETAQVVARLQRTGGAE